MKVRLFKSIGWHLQQLLYFTLVVVTTFFCLSLLSVALQDGGLSALEIVLLVFYTILMLWISASFWTAALGFFVLLFDRYRYKAAHASRSEGMAFKTALVMPVYNEDPERVFAGLRAIDEDLKALAVQDRFEIFILSDTRDPSIWVHEEILWRRWSQELGKPARIFYRNRPENTARKSGNLADFCRQWGGRYRYMIVLDADSLMSAETLIEMVRRMEAEPSLALLQVPPVPINRVSFFARMLQFAGSLYGRMFAAGLAFWQQDIANFWGHNAIIRVRPFADHCGLPKLPGREPFGGDILSHDFVEAALLARAGWKVRLAWDLAGSYEEIPPTLIDYAKRDRRWCQGNLQHARLIMARGFRTLSRIHFAMGVMSYAASPLWLLFLIATGLEAYFKSLHRPVYFFGYNIIPIWPQYYVVEMTTVLWVTLALLFLPKLLALIFLAFDRAEARRFGGLAKASLSALIESLFSVLLAPVLMLFQSKFVVAILLRTSVGWPAQQRGDHQTGFFEALGAHGGQTLLGLTVGYATYRWVPDFFWWFTPVLAGILLAIPVSILTSRTDLGLWARRLGLFLTPAETEPPAILKRLDEQLKRSPPLEGVAGTQGPGAQPFWVQAILDPRVYALHDALLYNEPQNRRRRHILEGLVFQLQDEGEESLSLREKRALLSHHDGLFLLHTRLWATPNPPTLPLASR
ncbi:glucans biosynthesis glucosyltransferase MdoH [Caldichromatium japonicum]|uniref:Glucans biosynthesis glucosyltransferase H n=1 Tax=Caldichromatium japonicum TaxID=2699430 RepID=A0A6G7VCT6_9GAMM|nr:glucans biosynthesis glucosyltransferase MdoH [Caldichromatium japonicum]QIK37686.1 glucans biosynthesis glucosyltransferase MdoH [Caldichromatium japonicum]